MARHRLRPGRDRGQHHPAHYRVLRARNVQQFWGYSPDPEEAAAGSGSTLWTLSRGEPPAKRTRTGRQLHRPGTSTICPSCSGPIPGMDELLAALRAPEPVIGVATSKRRASAERTLEARRAGRAARTHRHDGGHRPHKPDPEPLLLALQRLAVRPDSAVYIGDAVVDVQAAHAAGMDAIAVTWGAGDARRRTGRGGSAGDRRHHGRVALPAADKALTRRRARPRTIAERARRDPRWSRRARSASRPDQERGIMVPVSRNRTCQLSAWCRSCGVCRPLAILQECS